MVARGGVFELPVGDEGIVTDMETLADLRGAERLLGARLAAGHFFFC